MINGPSKALFHLLASSALLKKLASRYGMARPSSFARRFVAGETSAEAIEAAAKLEGVGLRVSLDLLGESVATMVEADQATRAYISVMESIVAAGVERNISLKLTQLGLDVDRATAVDNLRRILDVAGKQDFFVRIDMENSPYTEQTLDIFETIWSLGHRQVGVVLQSVLRRSAADLTRLNALGARVRLVKGAYKEPREVAYQAKAEVDAAFANLMRTLLREGTYPAIATHDPAMIEATKTTAAALTRPKDEFEFQLLYGVRRDLQASLIDERYRVRVYIPFGREWFPYFMRRLGERPANVGFVVRSLVSERPIHHHA
jgi:proline dehydrogenase